MKKFKVTPKHKTGYNANPIIVEADNESSAKNASRLNDFKSEWSFEVKELKQKQNFNNRNK